MHATKCVFSNKLQLDLCHSKAICNQACTSHRPRLDSFHQEPVVKCRSLVLCLVLRPVVEVLSQAACLKVLAVVVQLALSNSLQLHSTECLPMLPDFHQVLITLPIYNLLRPQIRPWVVVALPAVAL
jgi:hypothetical protein